MLNALSKLMDTAAWLCNQCFLQSAVVEFGAVIYNDFGVVSPNWRKEFFSRYNSILFIINKVKVISTPPSVVLSCFSIKTASH